MSDYALPKPRAGDSLPLTASKIGQLFSLVTGPDRGLYYAVALNPASWVQLASGPFSFDGPLFLRLIADVTFNLNANSESILLPAIFGKSYLIAWVLCFPNGTPASTFGGIDLAYKIALRASNDAAPADGNFFVDAQGLSYTGSPSLDGSLPPFARFQGVPVIAEVSTGLQIFSGTAVAGEVAGQEALGVNAFVRTIVGGLVL
jgi:hypothetical protein